MANIVSAGSGNNWNTGAIWVGGVAPGAGDTWEILNGHTVTIAAELSANPLAGIIRSGGQLIVAYPMSTSYFNGNITVDSGGKIYASRAASNVLRTAGIIYANGATCIDYGTLADPISNIAVGAVLWFSAASKRIEASVDNAVSFYGATRVRRTTLAAQAVVGATTIVLTDDLALRSGTVRQMLSGISDAIVIDHTPAQTAGGGMNRQIDAYRVTNYVAGTKTATLGDAAAGHTPWPRGGVTPNWNTIDTQREIGTPVYLITSNVGVRGGDAADSYVTQPSHAVKVLTATHKVSFVNAQLFWNQYVVEGGLNNVFTRCSFNSTDQIIYGQSILTDCFWVGVDRALYNHTGSVADDCVFIGGDNVCGSGARNCVIKNSIITGFAAADGGLAAAYGSETGNYGNLYDNCDILNSGHGAWLSRGTRFKNCLVDGCQMLAGMSWEIIVDGTTVAFENYGGVYKTQATLYSTTIVADYGIELMSSSVVLYRSFLTGTPSISMANGMYNSVTHPRIVSYDHAGVVGAYRAWMYGGIIENDVTEPIGVLAWTYKFTFQRADDLTYIDFPIWCSANQYTYVDVWLKKSANGMTETPRAQIVLPEDDPFFGGAVLSEQVMADDLLWQHYVLSYKPTRSRQAVLRVRGTNASGNLWAGVWVHGAGAMMQ